MASMDCEENEVPDNGNTETGSDQCRRISKLVRQESYTHSKKDGCSPRDHKMELRFDRTITIGCDNRGYKIGKL